MFIQLIKIPLRELSKKNDDSVTQNLSTIIESGAISTKNLTSDAFVAYSIARFNNGSVISFVLDRVPKKEPFAKGNTISSAILGSFIPRIVWPSKETSGFEMYLKYTGLQFEDASYGISQLAEGYANFGKNGGIYYMLVLGLTMSVVLYKLVEFSNAHPRYFLFQHTLI